MRKDTRQAVEQLNHAADCPRLWQFVTEIHYPREGEPFRRNFCQYCGAHQSVPVDPTERNGYGALILLPRWVRDLVAEAEAAGVFTRGIESDRKNRGSSINVDVYGYDEAQGLAVIQVRECQFRPGRYNKIRKDYYLIGRTESGNVFAHPVETPARSRKALETPETTVAFVLSRIWDCPADELHLIVRQGDVAFVPAVLPAGAVESDNSVTIRKTHRITGRIYRHGRDYYTDRASLVHTKRQHSTVRVSGGYYRIVEGYRAAVWGFTTPKGD